MKRYSVLPMLATFFFAATSSFAAADPIDSQAAAPAAVAQGDEDSTVVIRRRNCLGATATRIHRYRDACVQAGRVYSRDDIDRTGSMTISEALQRLDPSISRGR